MFFVCLWLICYQNLEWVYKEKSNYKEKWICTVWGVEPHYHFSEERDLHSLRRRCHVTFFAYRVNTIEEISKTSFSGYTDCHASLSENHRFFCEKWSWSYWLLWNFLWVHYLSLLHRFPFRWMYAGLWAPWSCCRSCFSNIVPQVIQLRDTHIFVFVPTLCPFSCKTFFLYFFLYVNNSLNQL